MGRHDMLALWIWRLHKEAEQKRRAKRHVTFQEDEPPTPELSYVQQYLADYPIGKGVLKARRKVLTTQETNLAFSLVGDYALESLNIEDEYGEFVTYGSPVPLPELAILSAGKPREITATIIDDRWVVCILTDSDTLFIIDNDGTLWDISGQVKRVVSIQPGPQSHPLVFYLAPNHWTNIPLVLRVYGGENDLPIDLPKDIRVENILALEYRDRHTLAHQQRNVAQVVTESNRYVLLVSGRGIYIFDGGDTETYGFGPSRRVINGNAIAPIINHNGERILGFIDDDGRIHSLDHSGTNIPSFELPSDMKVKRLYYLIGQEDTYIIIVTKDGQVWGIVPNEPKAHLLTKGVTSSADLPPRTVIITDSTGGKHLITPEVLNQYLNNSGKSWGIAMSGDSLFLGSGNSRQ